MFRAGLIERRQHPSDRRVWQLYLLEEARPLITTMYKIGEATRGEALQGVSEIIKRIAALADTYRLEYRYEKPLQ